MRRNPTLAIPRPKRRLVRAGSIENASAHLRKRRTGDVGCSGVTVTKHRSQVAPSDRVLRTLNLSDKRALGANSEQYAKPQNMG